MSDIESEAVIAQQKRYIAALENSIDLLKEKLAKANELADHWHKKYATLKLQEQAK